MKCPQVDARVRLTHDVPYLSLHRGTVGIVCSTWFAPALAYEVEFPSEDQSLVRVLLEPAELELEDGPYADVGGEPASKFGPTVN